MAPSVTTILMLLTLPDAVRERRRQRRESFRLCRLSSRGPGSASRRPRAKPPLHTIRIARDELLANITAVLALIPSATARALQDHPERI